MNRVADADPKWVGMHFVSHLNKAYLVIPNLYSCDRSNEEESSKALATNQLVGLFIELGLVRGPKRSWWIFGKDELAKLKDEESGRSATDLTDLRKRWIEELKKTGIEVTSEKGALFEKAEPIRNHGLFSKAEQVLTIAGWSEPARRDIEIFPLMSPNALTLVLLALNEPIQANVDTGDAATNAPEQ